MHHMLVDHRAAERWLVAAGSKPLASQLACVLLSIFAEPDLSGEPPLGFQQSITHEQAWQCATTFVAGHSRFHYMWGYSMLLTSSPSAIQLPTALSLLQVRPPSSGGLQPSARG